MTDREAIRMALEALTWIANVNAMDYEYQRKAREPIKALRQAFAQPEQDWDLLAATQESLREHQARIKKLEAQLAQPEQLFKYTPYGLRSDESGKLSIGEIPQRPWVGLTLNDITGHMCDCADDDGTYKTSCFIDYAKAIEQKLKDLNT